MNVENPVRRRAVMTLCASALLPLHGLATAGETPLRVILPVGAGAAVDAIMRAAGPSLGKVLAEPIVIENLPGAGGMTGALAVIKAPPDGQTIGVVANSHVVNSSVYKKLPFDPIKDITPISVVGATPLLLVVNPTKLPARSARELQALLKGKADGFNYASSGNGTILHLAAAMYLEAAGVRANHIPYKGSGPMMADLLGGHVDMAVIAVPTAHAHLKSGQLRAIGVMGPQRAASLPEVPTLAEQGFPDVDVAGWFAVIGPPRLPAAQVKRLHDAVVAAFATDETKAAMIKQETDIHPSTPEAALAFFRSEQQRYAQLVRKANISLD